MKIPVALLSLTLLTPAQAAAPTLESLSASGERLLLDLPPAARFQAAPPRVEPPQNLPESPLSIEDPRLKPLLTEAKGAVVGRINLKAQLDRHRDLLTKPLGPSTWNISVAGDPGFKNFFLTFAKAAELVIAPLGDLNRLRGDGIDVTVAPGVIYNFKVSINIFSPVRGSTLEIHPVKGTRGPKHDIKTGVVLDAVQARSAIFNGNGVEYWTLYGTDVDPATNRLAQTRSFLFVHMDGLSSKAWPVAESSVPIGQPATVAFGDNSYVIERTAEELVIRQPQ